MKGILLNVQKFSIHDGPGIRTTVFFKGCPLDCKWCSNPESKSNQIQIAYDKRKCVGCFKCIDGCDYDAIAVKDKRYIEIDPEKCVLCMACVNNCLQHALKSEGKTYSIENLMSEVIKDKSFYDESGGGVTLSGGEPLSQGEFAVAFLKELKKNKIHTVVETCGYVDEAVFKTAIAYIDLLYFDVKHYENKKHVEKTGVEIQPILDNLRFACEKKKDIVARIPMIPGFNDTDEDAQGFCELLKNYLIKKVHLLPFHQFGSGKYTQLGLVYEYKDMPNTDKESLKSNMAVFKQNGFDVQIGG